MTLYHLSQHFSSNIFSNIQLSKRIQKADKFIYYRDIPKNKLVSLLKFVRIFPFPMHNCKQAKKCELPILKFASKYFYNIAKNKKKIAHSNNLFSAINTNQDNYQLPIVKRRLHNLPIRFVWLQGN